MTGQENIIYCSECVHCFKNKRSKTGYSCEVWGHDDFANDTELSGFCHKAKAKTYPLRLFNIRDIQPTTKEENC